MKLCLNIIVTLLALFFTACTYQYVRPVCRHNAVYQALAFSDLHHCPTRIMLGPTGKPGIDHCQAQALINGKWVWLKQERNPMIYVGGQEGWFMPEKAVSIQEALRWSIEDD